MADRPILFSAPMIRALLSGSKTQTRRAMKPQPVDLGGDCWQIEGPGRGEWGVPTERMGDVAPEFLRIAVGDRLWCREAHALLPRTAYRASIGTGTIDQREHPTDGYTAAVFREGFDRSGPPPWRPSIHMPKWASRLTLIVTDVRAQRLQEISEEDAIAEGLQHAPGGWWSGAEGQSAPDPRAAFALLWTSINGDCAWDANPWVASYTFSVHKANIDAMPAPPLSPEKTGGANG